MVAKRNISSERAGWPSGADRTLTACVTCLRARHEARGGPRRALDGQNRMHPRSFASRAASGGLSATGSGTRGRNGMTPERLPVWQQTDTGLIVQVGQRRVRLPDPIGDWLIGPGGLG